ncbi:MULTISPECIES: hypothetical protein [unclassified Streptomyces]|uniref:hypothetical protein n=1 Tax=unclassified Streptomyces TaxID=2593676 RepID=UPI002F912028
MGASRSSLLRGTDLLPQEIQNLWPTSRTELNEQISLLVLDVGADLGAELDEQVNELGIIRIHPLKVLQQPLDTAVVGDLLTDFGSSR